MNSCKSFLNLSHKNVYTLLYLDDIDSIVQATYQLYTESEILNITDCCGANDMPITFDLIFV